MRELTPAPAERIGGAPMQGCQGDAGLAPHGVGLAPSPTPSSRARAVGGATGGGLTA